jgi:hypothetical protein
LSVPCGLSLARPRWLGRLGAAGLLVVFAELVIAKE